MTAVALRLGDLLVEKEMTQVELATISGITQNTITNILNQANESMHLKVLQKICNALDITLGEFFNDKLFDKKNIDSQSEN